MGLAFLVLAVSVIVAVVATGPRYRPLCAVLAALGATTCALLVPAEQTFARFVLTALGFVVVMRLLDLRIDRQSFRMRLWLFVGLVDVREARPIPRRVDAVMLVALPLYLGLAALGWWLAHTEPMLRWVGGVLVIYGLADAACGFTVPAYALAGWRIPRQHRAPILATSVSAFWSRHYNLNVSSWLARHFHRPLARRGRARLGVVLAFVASAIVHAYIAWVCLDLGMAIAMGAFFCVQGIAAAIERSWSSFATLPIPLRRAWTIAWLLLPSPLFVEPFLRILEG